MKRIILSGVYILLTVTVFAQSPFDLSKTRKLWKDYNSVRYQKIENNEPADGDTYNFPTAISYRNIDDTEEGLIIFENSIIGKMEFKINTAKWDEESQECLINAVNSGNEKTQIKINANDGIIYLKIINDDSTSTQYVFYGVYYIRLF